MKSTIHKLEDGKLYINGYGKKFFNYKGYQFTEDGCAKWTSFMRTKWQIEYKSAIKVLEEVNINKIFTKCIKTQSDMLYNNLFNRKCSTDAERISNLIYPSLWIQFYTNLLND